MHVFLRYMSNSISHIRNTSLLDESCVQWMLKIIAATGLTAHQLHPPLGYPHRHRHRTALKSLPTCKRTCQRGFHPLPHSCRPLYADHPRRRHHTPPYHRHRHQRCSPPPPRCSTATSRRLYPETVGLRRPDSQGPGCHLHCARQGRPLIATLLPPASLSSRTHRKGHGLDRRNHRTGHHTLSTRIAPYRDNRIIKAHNTPTAGDRYRSRKRRSPDMDYSGLSAR